MKKTLWSFVVLVACASLSFYAFHEKKKTRTPSSVDFSPKDFIEQIADGFSKKPLAILCDGELQMYLAPFFQFSPDRSLASLGGSEREDLIQKSFETRLLMREHLAAFDSMADQGKCLKDFRALTRAMRYVEDYLIEAQMPATATVTDYITLNGEGNFFLKNPHFEMINPESLQSGDVILSRGNAFVSALIGGITEIPNQFSHISFVYRDQDGKLWTTESHIEIGAVTNPIQSHVDELNARTLVFRYKDSEVAHRAAKYVFELVRKQQLTGKNVQYDFGMELSSPKRIFCSEVAYIGFQSEGLSIPLKQNKFPQGLLPFLKRLGLKLDEKSIQTFQTFAPGDIEFDSRFSLVAEWRNPAKLKKLRMRDALITKEVEWMSKKDYQFFDGFAVNAKSYVGWVARRLPSVKKKFEEKFPLNMSPGQLQANMVFEEVSDIIEKAFLEKQANADHLFSFEEALNTLEEIRKDDLLLYKEKKKKALFHNHFRAK